MAKLFSPWQIGKMTDSAINKAYSTLRSIANKRLQRQQAAGLGRSAREGFRFPTIQQITESSKDTVSSALADVSQFLRSPRTTVKGERKFIEDFRQSMEEKGYGDLVETMEDIYNTIDFMEQLREEYSSKIFDSGDTLDVLQQAQRLNIPKEKLRENFDLFAANLDKMEQIKPTKGGRKFSQQRINALIRRWT